MKTILYFKDRYIDRLEDLRNLFRGNINEDLKRELIASFQDGILETWLLEGGEECKLLLRNIKSLDKQSANHDIITNLKWIFVEENIRTEVTNSRFSFTDYCQIEEMFYMKIDKKSNATTSFLTVKDKDTIIFKKEEAIRFRLKVRIRVVNPDNERLFLNLKIKNGNNILSSISNPIHINKHKNEIIETIFIVNHQFATHDIYRTVVLDFNSRILWSFTITKD